MRRDTIKKTAAMWALAVGVWFACGWMLSRGNAFLMDDYTTITKGMFTPPSELFTLLPTQRYNDRPVGNIFAALLQKMFGQNYQGYHMVFVLVHLASMYLVYRIALLLFAKRDEKARTCGAFLAAAVFGLYPQSIMAVQWVSAVFDLLGCFFTVCALYAFLKKDEGGPYRGFYEAGAIASYVVSLRCKEMSALLPVFFLLYEMFRWKKREKKRVSLTTCVTLGWMAIYLVRLFTFPAIEAAQYHQAYQLTGLVRNLLRYINLYFDLGTGDMVFSGYSWYALPGGILLVLAILGALFLVLKKRRPTTLLCLVGVGLMLAPVLTMDNMQHKLYLYIPSVFLGLMAGELVPAALQAGRRNPEAWCVILILLLGLMNCMPGPVLFRNWWCSMAQQDAGQLKRIERLGNIPKYCSIYVRGAGQDYNVISPYGPGNSIRFLYERNDMECSVVEEFPEKPEEPYIFLDYDGGNFYEVRRDDAYHLEVTKVTYNRLEDNIQLGIECAKIYPEIQVLVNDEPYPTTVGETFISTEIDADSVESGEELRVAVIVRDLDAVSEPCLITIE